MQLFVPLTLVTLLFACGSGQDNAADAAVDGPSIDAPKSESAVVTVTELGTPLADVAVVIHETDGTVRETLRTDLSGQVVVLQPEKTIITIIRGLELLSFYDIGGGDQLRHDVGFGGPQRGKLNVNVAKPPNDTEITRTLNGCDEWGVRDWQATQVLDIYDRCLTPAGTNHVLGVAYGPLSTILAFTFHKDLVLQNNGDIDVTLPAWTTNFHDFSFGVSGGGLGIASNFSAAQVVDGISFRAPTKSGNTSKNTWQVTDGFADLIEYSFFVLQDQNNSGVKMFYGKRLTAAATEDTFDAATEILPAITNATADNSAPTRFALSWTTSGSLEVADAVIARTRYSNGAEVRWAFVVPSSWTTVTAPALPEAFADLRPTGADTPYVVAAESTLIDGYRDFLQKGAPLVNGPRFLESTPHVIRGAVFFPQPFAK